MDWPERAYRHLTVTIPQMELPLQSSPVTYNEVLGDER